MAVCSLSKSRDHALHSTGEATALRYGQFVA
jgi:hypothetical protein